MDKEQFWQMIDDARAKHDRWQNMYEPLHNSLMELTAPEIMHWQQIFYEYQDLSYKQKLWASAYTIMQGCSDDSFDYFRGWLIAQGKETFLNALADPESLADLKTIKAFGRESRELFYTPLQGYYDEPRFESMLYVAVTAYEDKTGMDFYNAVNKHPLSKQEKVDIANDIVYANNIDIKWGGLNKTKVKINATLKEIFPKLYEMFNSGILPEISNMSFSIMEKIGVEIADGQHMFIVQASDDIKEEIVWAIGDEQGFSITRDDYIRNDISYSDTLIKEFSYQEHTPENVKKWLPVVEALVEITAEGYLKNEGIFHTYPQWLPKEAYEHLGKELFDQMATGCDHIILRENNIMEFMPKNKATVDHQKDNDEDSVIKKIHQSKGMTKQQKSNSKKHKKGGPEY